MTTIKYFRRKNNVRWTVYGHARYNPGNDIVCSALSTITFQLINTVNWMREEKKIENLIIDIGDGSSIVTFDLIDEECWEVVHKVILIGYEMIAEQYPDYVKIEGQIVGVNAQ